MFETKNKTINSMNQSLKKMNNKIWNPARCELLHYTYFLFYQMKVKFLLSESIHIYCWIFTSLFKHKWKRKNFLEYAVISPNGLQLRVDNHYFALSRILHILPSILPCPFILLCQRSCDVCAIELIASSKY